MVFYGQSNKISNLKRSFWDLGNYNGHCHIDRLNNYSKLLNKKLKHHSQLKKPTILTDVVYKVNMYTVQLLSTAYKYTKYNIGNVKPSFIFTSSLNCLHFI